MYVEHVLINSYSKNAFCTSPNISKTNYEYSEYSLVYDCKVDHDFHCNFKKEKWLSSAKREDLLPHPEMLLEPFIIALVYQDDLAPNL